MITSIGLKHVLRSLSLLVLAGLIAFSHPAIIIADTISAAEIPEDDVSVQMHSPEAHEACIRDTERIKRIQALQDFASEPVPESSEEEAPEYYDGSSDKDSTGEELTGAPEPLPAQYSSVDLGYITPVKDQYYFGTCWAFATISAVEAYVLKNNVLEGMTKDNLDLSERHLVFYAGHNPPDPLGNTDGDERIYPTYSGQVPWDYYYSYLDTGDECVNLYQRLGAYFGIVEESVAPYQELIDKYEEHYRGDQDYKAFLDETMLDNTYENACEKDILHLTATHSAEYEETDKIKQMVMDYGAVTAKLDFSPPYLNYDNYAYYDPDNDSGAAHMVAIVGWDDQYSRNNFGNYDTWTDSDGTEYQGAEAVPEHDGAWLVKNSYGSEWGLDGYFWLSYDYRYPEKTVYACEIEAADHGWHVYMHDGGTYNLPAIFAPGTSLANVYKVPDDAQYPQLLTKAAFSMMNAEGSYELQVYLNPTDAANPASGTPMLSEPVTGNVDEPTYCFVELPEPLTLNPGDTYALVFTFNGYITPWVDYSLKVTPRYVSSYEAGECFFKKASSDTWTDNALRNYNQGAFRIRGYTKDYQLTDIREAEISSVKEQVYTGKEIRPVITVFYDGQTLQKGTDYELSYADNVKPGEARITVTGIGRFTGETTVSFKISKADEPKFAFSDVQDPSHPFFKEIYWAADLGITKGYSDGTFGINRSCTRGEAIMFLWRLAGKPSPKWAKSKFSDVSKSNPFYKAILWAEQKGITKGFADGTFGISKSCTRGQIMTFIWRCKNKPNPKVAAKSPFKDVAKNHPYYKAILWASQNGVAKGFSDGTYGINKACTRGQMMKFFYNLKK